VKCENCASDHNGEYGSGRFCSVKCARGFSTKENREEINQKVKKSVIEAAHWKKFSDEDKLRMSVYGIIGGKIGARIKKENFDKKIQEIYLRDWDELVSIYRKDKWKKFLLQEQENKCIICNNINSWNGKILVLQVDHIDGNNRNNKRNNLRMVCPNCHSQTENFSGKIKSIVSSDIDSDLSRHVVTDTVEEAPDTIA